jgi:hypothetical protein
MIKQSPTKPETAMEGKLKLSALDGSWINSKFPHDGSLQMHFQSMATYKEHSLAGIMLDFILNHLDDSRSIEATSTYKYWSSNHPDFIILPKWEKIETEHQLMTFCEVWNLIASEAREA